MLAGLAKPKEFQGVKQGLEPPQVTGVKVDPMHGTNLEGGGDAAIDTGQMVVVTLGRCIQGLATGQVAAAHQALLLQLAQVAVHRGQAHGALALAQAGVQILP